MEFMREPPESVAEAFIENFLGIYGEGCKPRLAMGHLAAVTPMGQRMLRECARRGIPIELVNR